jgi:hypothetical protein
MMSSSRQSKVEIKSVPLEIFKYSLTQVVSERMLDLFAIYPATLWDAIKDRFFPPWMLKRCPVKYKHHDIVVRELYPRLSLPDEYHVLNMDRREWVGD